MMYNQHMVERSDAMSGLCERLKNARLGLHLSQDYVAKKLGIQRTAIVAIENGTRKVSADELNKFSKIYNVSCDELLKGHVVESPSTVFARDFNDLGEEDQKEILNLIAFKKAYQRSNG